MYLKGWQIANIIEEKAPKKYAVENDNIGLQLGSLNDEIKKCLLTLDVTDTVLDEAINNRVQLIISHHPLLFEPLNVINRDKGIGTLITRAIMNDMNIYSAHTNLDVAPTIGVNSILADRFDLENTKVLYPTYEEKFFKIVVFIPEGYENEVKRAMFTEGAGWTGNYSHSAFLSDGTGNFKPLEGTTPFIGTKGEITEVKEVRLETIVPESLLGAVSKSMINAHPYEEPAYDIYTLANKSKRIGLGLVGDYKRGIETKNFIEKVKEKLKVDSVRLIGREPESIKKIALCGGSGEGLIDKAINEGADVYVTGDIKYHGALNASQKDLFVIDAGHYQTEFPLLEVLKNYLEKNINRAYKTEFLISQKQKDPFVCF